MEHLKSRDLWGQTVRFRSEGIHLKATRDVVQVCTVPLRERRKVAKVIGGKSNGDDDDNVLEMCAVGSASTVVWSEAASMKVSRVGSCDETWASPRTPLGDLVGWVFRVLNDECGDGNDAAVAFSQGASASDNAASLLADSDRGLPSPLKYLAPSAATKIATSVADFLDGRGLFTVQMAFCLRSSRRRRRRRRRRHWHLVLV